MIRSARLLALLVLASVAFTAMAAGRPLAPRPLGPSAYHLGGPQTAYADGRFLTVWYESVGYIGGHLFGALSDANGVKLSPRALPLQAGWPPVWYELVGAGDSFVLFEQDSDGARMVEIDAEGRVTGVRTIVLPESTNAQIVWNGTHFLAAVQGPAGMKLLMLDREGRTVSAPGTIPSYDARVDVVPTGADRFTVAAIGDTGLFAHEVTPAGIGPRATIATPGHFVSDPRPYRVLALPLGNGGVLVIWSSTVEQNGDLRSVVLHEDGTLGPESVLASHTAFITPLEAVPTGNGYLLTYSTEQSVSAPDGLWTLRLDAAGKPTGQPVLVEDDLVENGGARSAAAGTAAILVTYASRLDSYNIGAVAVVPGGSARAPELLSIREARQMQPVLGAGRGDVLAVWNEATGAATVLRAASVDADGNPGAATQVGPPYLLAKDTAFNGTHHLIVHGGRNRLLATRVTAAGTAADVTPIVLADSPEIFFPDTAVVWAGTRWVVVWTDGAKLYSTTVSSDGAPSAPRELDVHVPIPLDWIRGVRTPALAFDGEHVLLVWPEWQTEDCWQFCFISVNTTYAVRLTTAGDPADAIPVDLGIFDPRSLSVASSGSEFLVAADQYGAILQSGSTSLRVVMTPRELFEADALSDVTWDGTNYVVALRYYGWFTRWYLARLRLDRAGNDAAVRAGTPTLQPDTLDVPPSVAAPSAGNALFGVHEGTTVDGVSAVVYRERDFTPLPPRPLPPRNVQVRLLGQQSYEVSWEPAADGNPDAYMVEHFIGGRWTLLLRVPGDVTRVQVDLPINPPVVRVRAVGFGGASDAEARTARPRRRSVR